MPSPTCSHEHREHRREGAANVAERASADCGASAAKPSAEQQVADQAVVELHQRRIVDEVAPERGLVEGGRGEELAGHQRPVDVAAAGVDAGDQRAEQDLREGEVGQGGGPGDQRRAALPSRLQEVGLRPRQAHDVPGDQPEQERRRGRGGRRGASRRPTPCPALRPERTIHQPIDALQPAESAEAEKPLRPPGRQPAASARSQRKPAAQTRPTSRPSSAVAPFPPVDRSEGLDRHALVDLGILRAGAVLRRTRPARRRRRAAGSRRSPGAIR